MRLILIGCEYSGTTTLARAISAWAKDTMGADLTIHDHFKFPQVLHEKMTDSELDQLLALPDDIKASFQWHMMAYHVMPRALRQDDYIMVGLHIDEAVYAPLYKGYGAPWHNPNIISIARYTENHIMAEVPDIAMALVKASPDAIATRMDENPRKYSMLRKNDIEHVLEGFEEQWNMATIRKKQITIDTTNTTVEQSLADFVDQYEPYTTNSDRRRILARLDP